MNVGAMPRTSLALAPSGAPPGIVDREWVGKARALWRRLEREYTVVRPAQDQLIAAVERLLPRRRGFRRLPIAATLRTVASRWRALPAETRLGPLKLSQTGEKLSLAEVRVVPSRMRMESWSESELVLGLSLIQIDYGDQIIVSRKPLGDASLHAVARRYQRGTDRSDKAVLRDLLELACAFPEQVLSGGDFRVAASEGWWRGELMQLGDGGPPHLAARTYVAG
jgi:hypothetical protein